MSRHRRRRSQNAKTCYRARVVGLGTAAGAALTFGMTPLTAVAPARADVLDLLFDPIADALIDLAAAADPLRDLSQAWIDSPLGQLIDASGSSGSADMVATPAVSGGSVVDDAAAVTATASATDLAPSAGLGTTYTVTSQWDGGYVAEYTIDNSGTTPLNNWQLQFNLPAGESITNVWNATLTHTGTHYVLTPESYDSTIGPDGSVNLGFQASDTGTYAPPTQVTVDGQPVDGGSASTGGDTGTTSTGTSSTGTSDSTGTSPDTGVGTTYTVTSQWDGGYVAEYAIDNSGTAPLDNWQLQFNLPAGESITNVWNAVVTHSGNQYVLTPESYNSTIGPDGSTDVGFQATDTGTYAPPTHVTVDGQHVDSGSGSTASGGDTSSGTGTSTGSSSTGSGGDTGGGTDSTGDLISAQYGTTTIEHAYVVQNNAYNNSAGQSIDVTSRGFSITNENGSASTDGAPLAYPSIYMGCAYGDCSPGSPLPEELSQIQSATSSIDYTFPSSGTYDASYDIWLNPTPITNGVNEQELMIWFDHQGSIQPVGSPVGDATIDGKDFVVWEGNNGSNDVISYVATSPISSWNNFNLLGFIDNMETHEAVNNSWYLTSIQAGFEPWNGSVGAAVDSFSASVNGAS